MLPETSCPLLAHRLCFQAFRMSFSLLFLMLATENRKRYLYVSTHFRSYGVSHGERESPGTARPLPGLQRETPLRRLKRVTSFLQH